MSPNHKSQIIGVFFLVLVNLMSLPVTFAQCIKKEIGIELKQMLKNQKKKKMCKRIRKSLFKNRQYLVEYTTIDVKAWITVFTSDGDTCSGQSPFSFEIPFGPVKIDSFKLKLQGNIEKSYPFFLDPWQIGELIYIKLKTDTEGRALPPEIERISCPSPCLGGWIDRPLIPFPPTRKKFTPLTVSFSAIAASSSLWFLKERSNAKDQYEHYQNASSVQDAVCFRGKVIKSRTNRDIAGIISIASGVTFAALFMRDLFRKCQSEDYTQFPSTQDSYREHYFSLIPVSSKEGIAISISFKL